MMTLSDDAGSGAGKLVLGGAEIEPGKGPAQSGVCPEGGEADEGSSGDGFFSGLSGDEKEGSHPRRGSGRRRG